MVFLRGECLAWRILVTPVAPLSLKDGFAYNRFVVAARETSFLDRGLVPAVRNDMDSI